jgi:hypothetical protein
MPLDSGSAVWMTPATSPLVMSRTDAPACNEIGMSRPVKNERVDVVTA